MDWRYVRNGFARNNPNTFVVSTNIQHRHLEDRKRIAAELLKANPERSNRSIATEVKLDDKTIAAVRQAGEASAEIPHIAPTERIDTGGRKRARKTANEAAKAKTADEQVEALKQRKEGNASRTKDQPPWLSATSPTAPAELDELEGLTKAAELMEVGLEDVLRARAVHKIGNPELYDAIKKGSVTLDQAAAMLLAVPRFDLRELPFDEAAALVKDWFAALPPGQQSLMLATLESANDTVEAAAAEKAAA